MGWDLVGLVCSFWWLLCFPGNNPGTAYGKEDTAKRKECSWEKCSQQIHAWVRKWRTDPCSGKILSMKGFLGLQSTSLHKGGGRQHSLSYLLLYFLTLHKRFEKLLWKCWPLMYKNLLRRITEQGWVSGKKFHLLKPVAQAASSVQLEAFSKHTLLLC